MNRFRQICAITLLSVLLSASPTLAGDMPGGVISPPPPPPTQTSVTGDMPGPGVTSSSTSSDASVIGDMPLGVTSAVDPVTEFTLNVLQSVFSLF
ncbi:MAG: hypothetical protein QOJ02_3974 [Acidobacteriota bacterium]|nr:hypothetical protein [Acidobacteriota bacterium]